jgi:BlaI family transcriptional regulator, penicillinase repressor
VSQNHRLGDLQLAIMRVIWERGEASASEVHKALFDDRGLAVTTIKTMLRKMETRGVVTHRPDGRRFIYRATIVESDVRDGMVDDLVQRLFRGDSAALVNHLIEAGEIEAGELEELRARLARERKKRGR